MPKAIQPVYCVSDGKRYYAVFSTVTMSFHTPFYKSPRTLRRLHPEYKGLKVANLLGWKTRLPRAIKMSENELMVEYRVYRVG